MGFFKELFKERITLEIIAGGLVLTDKPLPDVRQAVLMPEKDGKVIISIPFADKKEWFIKEVDWQESHARNAGTAVGGAIVGGLVFGVVGAAVGGAAGGRRKDKSKAYLTIQDTEGNEHELLIQCDMNLYSRLVRLKV